MNEFTHNFFIPRFWVEGESGGWFFPSQIGDWFSIDFDFYYSFSTPSEYIDGNQYPIDPMGVTMSDALHFINVINPDQRQVICHYDILHLLDARREKLEEISYLAEVEELPFLYDTLNQTIPTYFLSYDQSWCLVIPYDNDCPFINFATDNKLSPDQLSVLLTTFPKYVELTYKGQAHILSH